VLHGKAAISIDLARRPEIWLGGLKHGPGAETWLKAR